MATASGSETSRRTWTTAEYLALPTDDSRTELIHGVIVVTPAAAHEHNRLAHRLGDLLDRWASHLDMGEISYDIDMVLSSPKRLVYRPDVLFVTKENERRRRKGRVYGPADLCVEVLSPSERPSLQGRKFADYERFGVQWYWTIDADPENLSLEENELVDGKFVTRAVVAGNAWFEPGLFPGLAFRLPPLLKGDLKTAVRGKTKRLM